MKVLGWQLQRLHALLHHRFCPQADGLVRTFKHPFISILAASLVALVSGLLVNPDSLVILALLVLVAFLGVVWPWIAVRGLSCEAVFLSPRCRVGEVVTLRLRVRNRWPWPVWGLSIRRGFVETEDASSGVFLARIWGWSEAEFDWLFRPHRRGVFPFAPAEAETGFPFGLVHARTPITVRRELVVWPASVDLDTMPDAVELSARESRHSDRRAGDCGDILGTRAFRAGDSLRRVHWRQTARHGRMIVTERQASTVCGVQLLVDVDSGSHFTEAGHSTLESVLSVAASVLESLHRRHVFVDVFFGDGHFRVNGAAKELRECLDAMARIPVTGDASASRACRFGRLSQLHNTITITTDAAFERHLAHHERGGGRFITIAGEAAPIRSQDAPRQPATAGCACRPWIAVTVNERLSDVLPQRWRRACHVA